ncbi:hypothetical protein HanPI659440_Chr17g0681831 [Helianthus annuus]|nr:hypothetical protein HanPI659440_Chr17g0681831 [Helianthus annuus]
MSSIVWDFPECVNEATSQAAHELLEISSVTARIDLSLNELEISLFNKELKPELHLSSSSLLASLTELGLG